MKTLTRIVALLVLAGAIGGCQQGARPKATEPHRQYNCSNVFTGEDWRFMDLTNSELYVAAHDGWTCL